VEERLCVVCCRQLSPDLKLDDFRQATRNANDGPELAWLHRGLISKVSSTGQRCLDLRCNNNSGFSGSCSSASVTPHLDSAQKPCLC
jgi:hypothetical protein